MAKPIRYCSVEGCSTRCSGHGFCSKHYERWRKHGDPLKLLCNPVGSGSVNKISGYAVRTLNGIAKYEHTRIAEGVLGKALPKGADVHHINGDRSDNRNSNLVICQDRAYHMLLHRRQRAYDATGNPNYVQCKYCKQWGPTTEIKVYRKSSPIHLACHYAAQKAQRQELKP